MDSLNLELPDQCGVMLLTGTALFPHSSMDLHIFEPRYRAMLEDALQGSWMFAIGNLLSAEGADYNSCVAPIGTVAFVNASRTLSDGRSALVITGTQAVKFGTWVADSDYPKASISPVERTSVDAYQEGSVRSLILDYAGTQLEQVPAEVKKSVMENLNDMSSLTALIDNVAHNFVSDSDLRHELMSELDDEIRASRLIEAISK